MIDWVFDEDRSTIRTGFGPENMTRLRRFAISLIKSKKIIGVSKKMRRLNKNTRSVLEYLKLQTTLQSLVWQYVCCKNKLAMYSVLFRLTRTDVI
jgi:hypothetical protein